MYATEYQEYIDSIAQGKGRRDGPLQWWLKPFALAEHELPMTDLEKAKQLLAEAGYSTGFKIQATVSTTLNGVRLAEIAKSQWSKIGVELEIKPLEWDVWVDTVWNRKDFSVYFLQDWNYEDPDRWLFPAFHSKGSQNYSGYADPQVDAWLEEQQQNFNAEERAVIIKNIQRKLLEDVPCIPLFTPITYFARYSDVADWNPGREHPAQFFFGGLRGWLNR